MFRAISRSLTGLGIEAFGGHGFWWFEYCSVPDHGLRGTFARHRAIFRRELFEEEDENFKSRERISLIPTSLKAERFLITNVGPEMPVVDLPALSS